MGEVCRYNDGKQEENKDGGFVGCDTRGSYAYCSFSCSLFHQPEMQLNHLGREELRFPCNDFSEDAPELFELVWFGEKAGESVFPEVRHNRIMGIAA